VDHAHGGRLALTKENAIGETGEIRQCGNLSGYSVGMNPWNHALSGKQTAPLGLDKHAAELSSDGAVSNEAEQIDNTVEAAPARH
jgi:hypothetical protein